LIIYVTEAT